MELPKNKSEASWKAARKKNGPRVAPEIRNKQCHDVLNNAHDKTTAWFRSEYPEAMKYTEDLKTVHENKSCPHCSQGKATRALLKQDRKNRYALLGEVSSDKAGPKAPADSEGKTFVQIWVDVCSG